MEASNTAAHAFVSSRLIAGNPILYGNAQGQLQCIQRTQNTAARIITHTRPYEQITPSPSSTSLVANTGADWVQGVVLDIQDSS